MNSLVSGNVRSCGCLKPIPKPKVLQGKNHGLSKTSEYLVWQALRKKAREDGLIFDEAWSRSAVKFIADVGMRPTKRYRLATVEGSLGFVPGNVFWKELEPWTAEKDRATHRIWKSKNKDKIDQWNRANCEKRRAQDRERRRRYRDENREEYRARMKRWNDNNPGAKAAHSRTRKARVRNAEGSHSGADVEAILKSQKYKCAYCPANLRHTGHHVDHIIAVSRGGSNKRSNLQATCPKCNMSKSDRDPVEFAQSIGKLI
ncbi:HNH endonuclease signature motif containing protein [Mesorhizobium sp.]|uniref:HNH endonuclease n=1 Tax=Mesorhizobium sp. TaxID=1871066 RepID=UPI0025D58D8C|nr:HNH endonuclease signature motif containing protein [Mesorhizobium sp.]